jgi:hypothetical protein
MTTTASQHDGVLYDDYTICGSCGRLVQPGDDVGFDIGAPVHTRCLDSEEAWEEESWRNGQSQ